MKDYLYIESEHEKTQSTKVHVSSVTMNCFEWAEALITSIIVVVIIFTFFFRIVNVSGHSMMNTIHDNDKVILSSLFYKPQPGDIVVITRAAHMEEPIIKRVIAVGGQSLKIDTNTGEVFVDGVLLDEPYIYNGIPTTQQIEIDIPSVIPEGFVFVMGDNRANSTDSRFQKVGLVDERNILGKAQCIVFPFDRIGGLYS